MADYLKQFIARADTLGAGEEPFIWLFSEHAWRELRAKVRQDDPLGLDPPTLMGLPVRLTDAWTWGWDLYTEKQARELGILEKDVGQVRIGQNTASRHGKQFKWNGQQLADCVSEDAAAFLLTALQRGVPGCFGKRDW